MTNPEGKDNSKAEEGENNPGEAAINKVNPNSAGKRAIINSENMDVLCCFRNQSVNS